MLTRQYRMNEAIAAFPNEQFYGGRLETADQNKSWTLGDRDPLLGIHMVGDEQEGSGHSFYNRDEAQAAATQVRQLLSDGIDGSNIGVISAYARQIKEIGSGESPDVA